MTDVAAPPSPLALAGLSQAGLLRPMQAVPAEQPFDSPEFIFELKWGGVRVLAFVEDGVVTLVGAKGRDVTEWYPELQSLPSQLSGGNAILDGEIVALGKEGYPDFNLLRQRFKAFGLTPPPPALPPGQAPGGLCYQVYDALLLNGRPLADKPLWQRKNSLHASLSPSDTAQATDFIDTEGVAFYDAAIEHKLEGIVAKRKDSEYRAGERSADWQELRILETGDFVIGGYTFGGAQRATPAGGRRKRQHEPFAELLVGAYDRLGIFSYTGSVSGPFTLAEAGEIMGFLTEQHTSWCPFVEAPDLPRFIHWCKPELVCRLRYSELTGEGRLRFPYFVALRPDLLPADCVLDEPV